MRSPRSPVNVCRVSEYETLSFEQSGPIVKIGLDRPEAANGMNDTMTRELAVVAQRCTAPEVKAVVLTGAGRFLSLIHI